MFIAKQLENNNNNSNNNNNVNNNDNESNSRSTTNNSCNNGNNSQYVRNNNVTMENDVERPIQDQYIVKKPTNQTEFDWQVFQQQAFLQQQLAQHNLQAYLSSLNTDTMTNRSPSKSSSISTASSHSDPIPIAMTQSPTPYPQTSNMLPQQHVSRPLPQQQREQPQQHITSPQRFSESNFTNQLNNGMINSNPLQSAIFSNHTSENKQLRDVEESNFSTSPLRADYGNNIISSIPASFTSNSIPVSVKQARNGSSSGDILFSNGAHDMINNISTWTNNSVLDALNSKSILQTIFPQSQEPSSLSMDKQQQQHQQQNMCSENNVTANNFQQTQNDPSYNRNLFMMSNQEGVQYNLDETEKNGPKTQVEANTSANLHFDNVIPIVTNADIRKKRSNWDNMMTSGPVEDFWTINDDYGFLT